MSRFLHLFRRSRFDRELEEELREHLREKTEELMGEGMSGKEARYAAQRQFGNTAGLRERSRDEWIFPLLDALWRDLHYAARVLRKSPAFTLVAVLCLALGIGANTVIFTVVDHVLLRALPYAAPERLVMLWTRNPSKGVERGQVSAADFLDFREQARIFDAMSAYASWPMNLTNVAEPMRLNGELVSANFFNTLGVPAELGRTFLPEEDQPDKKFVVVLSHRLWRRLGSSPQLVGDTLTLNRSPATVVGVMPASFNFLDRDTDFWMPLAMSAQNWTNREGRWLSVVARVAPDTTLREATSAMEVVADRLATAYPATDRGWSVTLVKLHDELVGNTRLMILSLQGAVVFLLLITCANLANLLLARASGRAREISVRAALGASRGRIVRQLIAESVLLGTLGGGLGLALAQVGVSALRRLGPGVIPRVAETTVDAQLVAYMLLCTGITVVLFGLVPAFHATRFDLRHHIYGGGRGTTHGAERQRSILVSTELALACILMVGASLLAESLAHLYATNPGFQIQNLLTMRITLPQSKYPNNEKQIAFFNQVLERIGKMHGIVAAGGVSDAPLSRNNMTGEFAGEGGEPANAMGVRFVTPGYLRTIGVPFLAGRDCTASDTVKSPLIAIVNQAAARRHWPGGNPIGKRLRLADGQRWLTVVGVVSDIKHMGIASDEGPAVYIPYAQKSWDFVTWTTLVIRTQRDPMAYANTVRSQIIGIDKDQPVSEIATMEQTLARSTILPLLAASIASAISLLAMIMAAVGVYGVVAYAVEQRIPEIGIRLALGAAPRQLSWLLLKQGMHRAGTGIAAGLIGAWAMTRLLTTLLFGVQPHDPATFAGVGTVLVGVTLIAMALPIRRAMHIDAASALRAE